MHVKVKNVGLVLHRRSPGVKLGGYGSEPSLVCRFWQRTMHAKMSHTIATPLKQRKGELVWPGEISRQVSFSPKEGAAARPTHFPRVKIRTMNFPLRPVLRAVPRGRVLRERETGGGGCTYPPTPPNRGGGEGGDRGYPPLLVGGTPPSWRGAGSPTFRGVGRAWRSRGCA